ncbi:Cytochrome P450 724B1 [Tripterygium wilfordii]|uniref:Cytochrome P450 724B1 n=1 Tax=Tripterygium wilfordii TaxID=458696 RepID=A0A7J7D0J3_TRIWF|nr:Cytochrome P450 724B1 [Tripterygium wilfordii]
MEMVGFLEIGFALIVGLSFAFLLLVFSLFTRQDPPNTPHGSMGWPFCGETLGFLKPHTSYSLGSFLQQHISRYGKVFKSHLFGYPTIVSCDYELNTFILQNEEKLFESSYPKSLTGVVGELSLLIATGDTHKKLRNTIVNFIVTTKSRPDFLHSLENLSISTMESFKRCKQVSFLKEVKKFTFNLIVKHLLSIEPEDPMSLSMLQDFETYMHGFVSFPLNIAGTAYAKAVKARARLSSFLKGMIKERQKRDPGLKYDQDFLDVMMRNWSLSEEETVSVALDILLGGYETTAKLMSLVVYFLGKSPHHFHKFKEEHKAIRENKSAGEVLNWDDYLKMEFTQKVLPMLSGPHLDPLLHENPLDFNPTRWNDQTMGRKVLPFGGGPRHCPGSELAKLEIAFFLHHFVLNFRWKQKADDIPIAYPFVEFRSGLLLEIESTE